MSGAGFDPASRGRGAGSLDSCFRRNDGRRHSIVICSRALSAQDGKAQQGHGKVGGNHCRAGVILGQALTEEQAQQRDG